MQLKFPYHLLTQSSNVKYYCKRITML